MKLPIEIASFGATAAASAAAAVLMAVGAASPAGASPWTREPGEVFLETRADYFRAGSDGDRFERLDSVGYFEWGVVAPVMIGGKIVYGQSWETVDGVSGTAAGLSELEGFVQATALRRPRDTLAFRVAGARPASLASGVRPATAADGADLEARILYGRNLVEGPTKIFVTGEAAFRKRFGAAADQTRIDASVGIEPGRRWLLLAEALGTVSFDNASEGGADYDVLRLQPSIVWRGGARWAIRLGGAFEVATRNLDPGRTVFLGLWSTF